MYIYICIFMTHTYTKKAMSRCWLLRTLMHLDTHSTGRYPFHKNYIAISLVK